MGGRHGAGGWEGSFNGCKEVVLGIIERLVVIRVLVVSGGHKGREVPTGETVP